MAFGNNTPEDDPSPRTHTSQTTPLSVTIVHQIAKTDECDPAELPPLYKAIDPDALDALYAHGSLAVQFEYAGHNIKITPDEIISVESDD